MHNRNIQWAYVTADRLLADKACWLHWAYLVVSAASTDSALYDGHDANGRKLTDLKSAAVTGHEFKPPKPLFCRQGLFVDVGTNVSGIFVEYEMAESGQKPPHPIRPEDQAEVAAQA
jgi:hypothetical protein